MALIKQNVMGAFTGKVGTLTTYNTPAGNIARIRTNSTNIGEGASRTTRQQRNRVRWANLVNFYKVSADWMKKAYEGKKRGISDYNRMMQLNFGISEVALTKQEAAVGSCIVDAYLVSQGSLAPVRVQQEGNVYRTNIRVGSLSIGETTTVAEFASAVIAENTFLRRGMQLSMVSYQQDVDDLGFARVVCTAYELILDPTNTADLLWSYIPSFAMQSNGGYLVTSDNISVGAFAFILSETRKGKTNVSTQYLVTNNEALLMTYKSAEQLEKAIASYGQGDLTFLDSTEAIEQEPAPQPTYILACRAYNDRVYGVQSYIGRLGNFLDETRAKSAAVVMNHPIEASLISEVYFIVGGMLKLTTKTFNVKDGSYIQINGASTWTTEYDRVVNEIGVVYDGVTYKMPFVIQTGHDVVE